MSTYIRAPNNTRSISQPFEKQHIKSLQAGTILWLPSKEKMPKDVYIDPGIQDGAFNHPCVVLSLPEKVNFNSTIEIAKITSKCKTLPSKNKSSRIRTCYFRIVTTAKPFAKDCLHFKNGMGMSRHYSSVFLKSFKISVRALELYHRGLAYVLTKQSLTKLLNGIQSNILTDDPYNKRGQQHTKAGTGEIESKTRIPQNVKEITKNDTSSKSIQASSSRAQSEPQEIIVISDTESEADDWVVPQTRLQKKLSISGISKRSPGPEVTRKKMVIYPDIDEIDDDENLLIQLNAKRKRDMKGFGKDEDDLEYEEREARRRRRV